MKILQVNKFYHPWIGGVETVVKNISEGLNSLGFNLQVLCCNDINHTEIKEIGGVKVVAASIWKIVLKMPISFSFFYYFYKMTREVDIVDLHHPFPLSFLAYFIFRPKAKLVIHYHSDIIKQKKTAKILQSLFRFVLHKASAVIVSSPNLIESSKLLSEFKKKCVVISFGIDSNHLMHMADDSEVDKIRQKYGKFVLYVGRLSYYKGVEYLIEAFCKIDAKLVIIGEGEEALRLKKKVDDLKINSKVYFINHVGESELANYYRAANVFVLPSIYPSETFGIVLLEAMSLGTPVISTELGTGTSYVNKNGETGFVVPIRDSCQLVFAINKILRSPNLHAEFSKKSFNRIRTEFDLKKMLAKTKEVYKKIIYNQ